ncbi:MAG: flagellar biosynthetic protein FliO [Lachnospiraceae bacterium]|nr:flagellar biosynthetic protein FliO [Lachnospiraceae bacterium]
MGSDGFIQLVTVLAIFAVVLAVTYFTSRLVGGYAKSRVSTGNIEIIESAKVAPSRYIAIVRTASKYIAVGIGKDEITYLCDIPEDTIVSRETGAAVTYDFKELMEKAKARLGKKNENT